MLKSRFNVRNRLIGTQMTSQIAGIDILHILSNENTYMKQCSKGGGDAESIYTNLTSCLIYIWGKKLSWYMWKLHNPVFWGFSNTYVSKCRKITRRRRNMLDGAFESWWFMFLNSEKILVIRTHPQELHVVKCSPNTQILTHFGPQWGQQMLTKCYLNWKGCSSDFQRLKVWPLGVPKPCWTSS